MTDSAWAHFHSIALYRTVLRVLCGRKMNTETNTVYLCSISVLTHRTPLFLTYSCRLQEEVIKLAKFTDFQTVCVVGGQSIEEQGYILRKGVEIVIGTPVRKNSSSVLHAARCHSILPLNSS